MLLPVLGLLQMLDAAGLALYRKPMLRLVFAAYLALLHMAAILMAV
jgi:hypothetical protein